MTTNSADPEDATLGFTAFPAVALKWPPGDGLEDVDYHNRCCGDRRDWLPHLQLRPGAGEREGEREPIRLGPGWRVGVRDVRLFSEWLANQTRRLPKDWPAEGYELHLREFAPGDALQGDSGTGGDCPDDPLLAYMFQMEDVQGASFLLAAGVLVLAAIRGRPLPNDMLFTGRLDAEGRVKRIGVFKEKIELAHPATERGYRHSNLVERIYRRDESKQELVQRNYGPKERRVRPETIRWIIAPYENVETLSAGPLGARFELTISQPFLTDDHQFKRPSRPGEVLILGVNTVEEAFDAARWLHDPAPVPPKGLIWRTAVPSAARTEPDAAVLKDTLEALHRDLRARLDLPPEPDQKILLEILAFSSNKNQLDVAAAAGMGPDFGPPSLPSWFGFNGRAIDAAGPLIFTQGVRDDLDSKNIHAEVNAPGNPALLHPELASNPQRLKGYCDFVKRMEALAKLKISRRKSNGEPETLGLLSIVSTRAMMGLDKPENLAWLLGWVSGALPEVIKRQWRRKRLERVLAPLIAARSDPIARLDDTIDEFYKALRQEYSAQRAFLRVFHPRESQFLIPHEYLKSSGYDPEHDEPMGPAILTRTGFYEAFHNDANRFDDDVKTSGGKHCPPPGLPPTRGYAVLVLKDNGQKIGVLGISWPEVKPFPDHLRHELEEIAAEIAWTAKRALIERLRPEVAKRLHLEVSIEKPPATAIVDTAIQKFLELYNDMMQATGAVYYHLNRQEGFYRFRQAFATEPDLIRVLNDKVFLPKRSSKEEGLVGWIARRQLPINLANHLDVEELARIDPNDPPVWRQLTTALEKHPCAYLGFPVRIEGETLGVIRFMRPAEQGRFSRTEEELLQPAADKLASYLFLAEVHLRRLQGYKEAIHACRVSRSRRALAKRIAKVIRDVLGPRTGCAMRVFDRLPTPDGGYVPSFRLIYADGPDRPDGPDGLEWPNRLSAHRLENDPFGAFLFQDRERRVSHQELCDAVSHCPEGTDEHRLFSDYPYYRLFALALDDPPNRKVLEYLWVVRDKDQEDFKAPEVLFLKRLAGIVSGEMAKLRRTEPQLYRDPVMRHLTRLSPSSSGLDLDRLPQVLRDALRKTLGGDAGVDDPAVRDRGIGVGGGLALESPWDDGPDWRNGVRRARLSLTAGPWLLEFPIASKSNRSDGALDWRLLQRIAELHDRDVAPWLDRFAGLGPFRA